jgi:hypothetical protein
VANPGPHGFSEMLYAFSSMGNNNGSAFAGLTATSPFWTIAGGRGHVHLPLLAHHPRAAMAGPWRQETLAQSPGTLLLTVLFSVGLLVAVCWWWGAVTFVPRPGPGARGRTPGHVTITRCAMSEKLKKRPEFDAAIVRQALVESIKKLSPARQVKNPVMFTVYVGSILTTALAVQAASGQGEAPFGFVAGIAVWLWATVLFRQLRRGPWPRAGARPRPPPRGDCAPTSWPNGWRRPIGYALATEVPAVSLRRGDVVLVAAGDTIPCDGEDPRRHSPRWTNRPSPRERPGHPRGRGRQKRRHRRHAPVVRLAGWFRVAAQSGETFLDRMISLVEGANVVAGPRTKSRSASCSPP